MTTELNRSNEKPSILVVDDSTANLELLTGILRKNGYEARPALNGKLACKRFKKLLQSRGDRISCFFYANSRHPGCRIV